MSLPTPNLRLDTDKHFVYSRKIMMEKWVEHLTAEVKKQQKTQAELAMVTVRKNTEYIKEALSGTISEERIQELLQTAKRCGGQEEERSGVQENCR
uniref:Uncharacterized protein n=2 Tax=Caenorhabditis japonica TaxID=281687 RepID=A0A8R1IN96_CAEJA